MEGFFEIGKIAGTHGLKGALRVFPTTQDPTRFEILKEVTLDFNGNQSILHIEKVGYHKKFVLLNVKEINDINIAETYKGGTLLIPEAQALPLTENEYYARDLYGVSVVTDTGEDLGELADIIETGANDVYSIKKEGEKELLIPAIKQCILDVDIKGRKMTVHLIEGLRE